MLLAKVDADPIADHFVEHLKSWRGLREWASWITDIFSYEVKSKVKD